jgi:prepilin-type N-terminal cleavage/methylation domain-containing protein
MLKRAGLTLLEVLMAIFIMGIGMLSVLAMFPAAADMMGRAISNSQMAEGLVNARGLDDGMDWLSSNYKNNIYITAPNLAPAMGPNTNHGWVNPVSDSPTFLFLDQYAAMSGVNRFGQSPNGLLPVEVAMITAFSNPPNSNPINNNSGNPSLGQIAGRFFTCNSDVVLSKYGLANLDDDNNATTVEREAKFTLAYFFTRPMPLTYPNYAKRNILLFKDRSQTLAQGGDSMVYFPLTAANVSGSNLIQVAANSNVPLKTKQWVMVTDKLPTGGYPTAVDFYEIRSVDDTSGTNVDLELGYPVLFSAGSVYLLKDVVRVALVGS